jgi:hypothetical protein
MHALADLRLTLRNLPTFARGQKPLPIDPCQSKAHAGVEILTQGTTSTPEKHVHPSYTGHTPVWYTTAIYDQDSL